MKKTTLILTLSFIVALLYIFRPIFTGHLPVPADTVVGLYHPYRDLYAPEYPNGIPYKNYLITDPVRQIIPWKVESMSQVRRGSLPTWNPYEMAGKPLLGNFQSSVFYPLNIFLFIQPFQYGWTLFVISQLILTIVFTYLYLKNLGIRKLASSFGAVSFGLSGFAVAWFEWGSIVHTVLWLPLILLAIDKLVLSIQYRVSSKKTLLWSLVYIVACVSSLFGGHLQTHFYLMLFSVVYALSRSISVNTIKKFLPLYLILNTLYLILTIVQWLPTLRFIALSARNVDQAPWLAEGWYLPWQHLAQLVAPDFFGNYSTLNYWGVWNYGEFVSYIGIIGLLFVLCAILARRDKKTYFFATVASLCILLMTPNPVAALPYQLKLPFISTAQPTRMLSIFCFCMSVLAACGLDWYLRNKNLKRPKYTGFFVGSGVLILIMVSMWVVSLVGSSFGLSSENLAVARKNLILPTGLLMLSTVLISVGLFLKNKKYLIVLAAVLLGLHFFDLSRFFAKFESFSKTEYFYPTTKTLSFLQSHAKNSRVHALNDRIMPPNFYTYYGIQSVEGYDPLYLLSYAEFIIALERNRPDIRPPFGFNRIITPHTIDSKLYDLLNVSYVLSFDEIKKPGFRQVMQEGTTRVYENTRTLPRAFFVRTVESVPSKDQIISRLFEINHSTHAIIEGSTQMKQYTKGTVTLVAYTPDRVVMKTENLGEGFLVFLDTYYPTWTARVDNTPVKLYKTNYTFRGVVVPAGSHHITFSNSLL